MHTHARTFRTTTTTTTVQSMEEIDGNRKLKPPPATGRAGPWEGAMRSNIITVYPQVGGMK